MLSNSRNTVFLFSLRNHLVKSFCSNQPDKEIIVTNPTPYFTKLMINRPNSLNALTYSMCQTIHALVPTWNQSSTKVSIYLKSILNLILNRLCGFVVKEKLFALEGI